MLTQRILLHERAPDVLGGNSSLDRRRLDIFGSETVTTLFRARLSFYAQTRVRSSEIIDQVQKVRCQRQSLHYATTALISEVQWPQRTASLGILMKQKGQSFSVTAGGAASSIVRMRL